LAVALNRQEGIDVTVVLDERSAGFFALGAAHAGGEPVALLCTSGTAAANYHPAVAEGDLSAVPLIVLTADRPPELRGNGSGQTIDQIKLYGDSVRWFCEVGSHDGDDAGLLHMRALACRAWAASAGEPRPGPVHLNFPFRDPLDPSPRPGAVSASDELARNGRSDGRPLTRVTRTVPAPGSEDLDRITDLFSDAERPLIVAGRQTDPGLRGPVARLAAAIGAPVLAEPVSQLRVGPHDRSAVISGYDRIAGSLTGSDDDEPDAGLTPDLVIRFGETPTSKNLRTWLAGLRGVEQVVVDPAYGWYEPSRTAGLILRADPTALSEALVERLKDEADTERGDAFTRAWKEAELRAVAGSASDVGEPDPRRIHEAIGRALSDDDLVYTASSMAIRDQEAHLPSSTADVVFLSNRGANGIDGLIASACGAAAATGRPTTVVTGDLGFQHDLGSLALVASSAAPVTIVVINDGGGRIFSRLPQKSSMPADEFDFLMRTPTELDIKSAAAMFDVDHQRVADTTDLAQALEADGTRIIEIPLQTG
jgi:2-succinyl-5-enolpyruvyl-6-hydroxy-3-cyclohexene-1-carboxylate synthase